MSNILKIYNHATEEDLKHGLAWYPYARLRAVKISKKFNIDFDKVCGVISALSPRNKWERNLLDAHNLIKGWKNNDVSVKVCTFGNCKQKAIDILNGVPIEEVLKGQKTWNFYNNIKSPFGPFVTIDFHAANIYEGNIGSRSLTPKQYNKCADAYKEVAEEVGIPVSSLQAITWVVWRNKREELVKNLEPVKI